MPDHVPTPRLSAQQKWSLIAAYACIFANGCGMGLSLPLLSLIMERNGVPATVIGLNAAAGSLAMMAVTPFISGWAARFGAIPFLLACYVTVAVCLLGFRATDSLAFWFALRILMNAGLQGLFLISELWINQISPESMRGRLVAIYAALVSMGFAIGPIIIQVLGTRGWEPFIAGAALMLAAAIPLWLARHAVPPITAAPASAMAGYFFKAPSATYAVLAYGAIEMAAASFLTIYGVRQGATEASATLLITAWGLGNFLLQFGIGWISDLVDRRAVLIGCGVAGVIGALALPFVVMSPDWTLMFPAFVLVFLWGGAVAGLYTVGLAHLGSKFQGSHLAAANAAFSFLYGVGTLSGPALGGAAMDAWNPHGFTLALAGIAGLYVILAVWRRLTSPAA
jgi:MFS family permease